MNNYLPLGEKIRQIRMAKGLSQQNLAHAIKKSDNYISNLETGQREITPELLAGIRKFLEIESAPLLDNEQVIYRRNLDVLDDLLNANRLEDAKAKLKELSTVANLPYEHELLFAYMMMEARLLIKESKIDECDAKLDQAELIINKVTSNKLLYQYHRNRGLICDFRNKTKEALGYHLQALHLLGDEKPNLHLLSNIGAAYLNLGKCHHAIRYLERSLAEYSGDKTNPLIPFAQNILAICYMHTGSYDYAKKLFDESILYMRSVGSSPILAEILAHKGLFCHATKSYEEAITYFDEAMGYLDGVINTMQESNPQYISFTHLYVKIAARKAMSLIKLGNITQSNELINAARPRANGDELLSALLDTASHQANLLDPASAAYLEEVAIPYFRSSAANNIFTALEICMELKAFYKRKKSKIKMLSMSDIICEIYEEMFLDDSPII